MQIAKKHILELHEIHRVEPSYVQNDVSLIPDRRFPGPCRLNARSDHHVRHTNFLKAFLYLILAFQFHLDSCEMCGCYIKVDWGTNAYHIVSRECLSDESQ